MYIGTYLYLFHISVFYSLQFSKTKLKLHNFFRLEIMEVLNFVFTTLMHSYCLEWGTQWGEIISRGALPFLDINTYLFYKIFLRFLYHPNIYFFPIPNFSWNSYQSDCLKKQTKTYTKKLGLIAGKNYQKFSTNWELGNL